MLAEFHWRTKTGVAACSRPALQAHLLDDVAEVTCEECRRLAGRTVSS